MGLKDRIFSRPAVADPGPVTTPAPDQPEAGPQAGPAGTAPADTMVIPASSIPAAAETQRLPAIAPQPEPQAEAPAAEPAERAPEPAAEPVPADPAASVPANPGWRMRGRLRRRMRYLREVRELGYRDLGGLVFDQHRFQRPNDGLVQGKVLAIDAVDRELRAIEQALRAGRLVNELALPGISACQRCGALHGSDARFCPQCGLAFAGPRTVAGMGDLSAPVPAPIAGPGQAALFDPTAGAPAPSGAPAPPAAPEQAAAPAVPEPPAVP